MAEKKKLKDQEADIKKLATTLLSEESYSNKIKLFQQSTEEIKGSRGVQVFKDENARNMLTLSTVYENELKLAVKCNDFNEEIVTNAARVERILDMNTKDQEAIDSIVKELNTAHSLFLTWKDKEERAREATKVMRENFNELVKVTGAAMGSGEGNAESTMDILKKNGELMAEIEKLNKDFSELSGEKDVLLAQQKMLETLYIDATALIKQLRIEMQQRENEGKREQRRREQMERDMRMLKSDAETKANEAKNLRNQLEDIQLEVLKNESSLKDMKMTIDKSNKEGVLIQENLRKMQHDLVQQEVLNANLNGEVRIKIAEIKNKEDEYIGLKSDFIRQDRFIHQLKKKVKSTEEAKIATEKHLETKRLEMLVIEKDLDMNKKNEEKYKFELNEMSKENELMRREILRDRDENARLNETLVGFIDHISDKQKAISELKNDMHKQGKYTKRLEIVREEKQRLIQRLTNRQRRMDEDAIDIRRMLKEAMHKIDYLNKEVKRLDGTRDGLTKERNYANEHLVEAQDLIVDKNKILGLKSNQIDQLKEQTSHKEAIILKEQLINKRLSKDYDKRMDELTAQKLKIKHLESAVSDEYALKKIISKEIHNAETEVRLNKNQNKKLRAERDILGSQLKRRNDEISLLYKKISILEDVVKVGRNAYDQRLDDIRVMRVEINRLNCCKQFMEKGLGTLEDMRREAYDLHQECLQLRTRVRMLEEELENPINIHRWRSLQGSDPERYELILKIQTLQRILIRKSQEATNSDRIISEMTLNFEELKKSLGRQPHEESTFELAQCRRLLRKKEQQIKASEAIKIAFRDVADEMTEKNIHFRRKISDLEAKITLLQKELKKMPAEDADCLKDIKLSITN